MYIFVDSEGDPLQEFSALYVNECTFEIVDVFHHYVKYPFIEDYDAWSRRHVHGLDINFLEQYGYDCEHDLLSAFNDWLKHHPHDSMFANAPKREEELLGFPVSDVSLPPWKDRVSCLSHRLALSLKQNAISICDVTCDAHGSFLKWRSNHPFQMTPTDFAKQEFGFHCSLYDCVEIYFYLLK